jgi:hypothetical protein
VADDNEVRLHGAIGHIAPADRPAGRDRAIFAERDRKLEAARERGPAESAGELIDAGSLSESIGDPMMQGGPRGR